MKLALILPAVIGMLDSEMSALGQGPGFPDGRPLQVSPTSLRLVDLPPQQTNPQRAGH